MSDFPTKLMRIAYGALEFPDDEAIVRDAADLIVRLELALGQAVAYAEIVARAEGMPAGKMARRLTATAVCLDGSGFETAEFDVAAARALTAGK